MKPTMKATRERLNQLAEALEEIYGMPHDSVPKSIRRVLRLLELCPWIEEAVGKDAEEPAKSNAEPKKRGRKKKPVDDPAAVAGKVGT